jgi:hypothetical protein
VNITNKFDFSGLSKCTELSPEKVYQGVPYLPLGWLMKLFIRRCFKMSCDGRRNKDDIFFSNSRFGHEIQQEAVAPICQFYSQKIQNIQ